MLLFESLCLSHASNALSEFRYFLIFALQQTDIVGNSLFQYQNIHAASLPILSILFSLLLCYHRLLGDDLGSIEKEGVVGPQRLPPVSGDVCMPPLLD